MSAMSTPTSGWFAIDRDVTAHLPTLSGAAAKLLLALAARAQSATGECWPSWSILAEDTGLTRASVSKGLAALVESNLIEIVPGNGVQGQGGASSLYRVLVLRSGSKNELVQKMNRSGSKSAHEVVQKMNSNKNKRITITNKRGDAAGEMDSWFSEFWKAYPRHVAKEAARKAYRAAIGRIVRDDRCEEHEAAQTLLEAAGGYARSMASTEQRFVKHPATWLNGGCHADELVAPAPAEPDLPFFGSQQR